MEIFCTYLTQYTRYDTQNTIYHIFYLTNMKSNTFLLTPHGKRTAQGKATPIIKCLSVSKSLKAAVLSYILAPTKPIYSG